MQLLTDMSSAVEQSVIDDAIDQLCRRLHACLQATTGHFEYSRWHKWVKTVNL